MEYQDESNADLELDDALNVIEDVLRIAGGDALKIERREKNKETTILVIPNDNEIRLIRGLNDRTINAIKRICAVTSGRYDHRVWLHVREPEVEDE